MSNTTYIIILIILIILIIYNYIVYYKPPFKIDVVYTWSGETQTNNNRTSNNNELKYSLRSVFKYAPWINKVYILMNPPKKTPVWFKSNFDNKINNKIIIIDHKDTYLEYTNKVTNSNSIETTLHNIPGLSEQFIYFNDDVFLGKRTKYTDFFTLFGTPLVPNSVLKVESMKLENNQDNIKYPKFVKQVYPHVPISLLKSQIIKFQETYPEYIKLVRSKLDRKGNGCDLCDDNKLKCPCAQQHHLVARFMYDNNKASVITYKMCEDKNTYFCDRYYINSDSLQLLNKFIKQPAKFFCINDSCNSCSTDKREDIRNKMNDFFEKYYPEKPEYEI